MAEKIYDRQSSDLPPGDQTGSDAVGAPEPAGDRLKDESWLLQKSLAIYTASTDYITMNVEKSWALSLAHFRGQHAAGSRYGGTGYKRSNIFRPKTRSNIKAQEAGAAQALFSTLSIVDIQPEDPTNEEAVLGAEVAENIVKYRLTKTVPWFLTVMGAWQDTKVYGLAIGHPYWDYRATKTVEPVTDDETGEPLLGGDPETGEPVPMGREVKKVEVDKLCVDLIEPENFRFDPTADWRDPAQTSPYLVWLRPMSVGAVEEMMAKGAWRGHDRSRILTARRPSQDRTRQAREGQERIDPAQTQSSAGDEFTTVWAHLNLVRIDGTDYVWWTLGTELLLTLPEPAADLYPHLKPGERPFVVGFSAIEAHRNYPDSDAKQGAPIQIELNDVVNQRLDNVKLVLNKRYFLRRGAQIDLDALVRNVPGGGVMMNDPEKDVQIVNTPDVTGSSYQEQDRLSNEFDELLGGFSQSSVMSNRKLNETVGGMDRMASAASATQDLGIKVFIETWVEPMLRQIHKLLALYETDETVLALAAKNSRLWKQYGVDRVTDQMLMHDLTVQINVGVGNSDPVKRVERLVFATGQVMAMPGMAERAKPMAVANNIFGALGFKDASPFFKSDEEMANAEPQGPPPEIALKMKELEIREQDNVMRHQRELAKLDQDRELEMMKIAAAADMKLDDLAAKLGIEKMKNKTLRDTTALKEANRLSELNLKQATGSGI